MKLWFYILLIIKIIKLSSSNNNSCLQTFINEFHYDDKFRDTAINDFVEVAAPVLTIFLLIIFLIIS